VLKFYLRGVSTLVNKDAIVSPQYSKLRISVSAFAPVGKVVAVCIETGWELIELIRTRLVTLVMSGDVAIMEDVVASAFRPAGRGLLAGGVVCIVTGS
jgi:hypothetical protein